MAVCRTVREAFVVEYIKGECSLQNAINKIKLNTRHYAKRQKTFFKKLAGLTYLQPEDVVTVAKRIVDKLC